jgi:hypothetical protein
VKDRKNRVRYGLGSEKALYGGKQFHNSGRFRDEGIASQNAAGRRIPRNVVICEEHDFDGRVEAAYLVGGGYAIYVWHVDIEKNEVGVQLSGLVNGFAAAYRFAANFDGTGLENGAKLSAGGPMIVGNKDRRH